MCSSAAHILVVPFVVEFIYNEYSVFVAEVEEGLRVGVVRCAYVVHAVILNQLYALLHGAWVGCCTECSESVVVGIAFEQHLLAVEQQSLAWHESHVAYAEPL